MKLSKRTIILLLLKLKDAKNPGKKMWVRKIFQERSTKGEFNLLIRDLRLHDAELYFKYFRMNVIQHELLLSKVAPLTTKTSRFRECTDGFQCLHFALRYAHAQKQESKHNLRSSHFSSDFG